MSLALRSRSGTSTHDPDPGGHDAQAREAIEQGDHRRALIALMRAHGADILRYCERMLGDPERAADVRQVVFVQAYRGLGGYAGRSSPRAWLFGIARHRCLDTLARRRREKSTFTDRERPPGEEPAPQPAANETWEMQRAILECLGRLEPRVRESVLLRCQDGFSFPELARMLGERAGTIQARVSRATERLRRCLFAHGVQP